MTHPVMVSSDQNEPFWTARPGIRMATYAALLIVVATIWSFYRLSAGTLLGDEAAFACTTDRMKATGDWVVPRIVDEPHLNATPLYNWLTLLVGSWFDESPLWYRFCSAIFGVGCVLATFALGAALYGPTVGLLAGLLLIFNRDFLFMHGIRYGGMDALLTFFITVGVLFYVRIRSRSTTSWVNWAGLGLCFGLACLSKPPAFGVFFFGTIVLLHLATRQEPFLRRFAGPLFAAAVAVLIASPWYIALWLRLGNDGLHALFVHNSVERALDSSHRLTFWWHYAIVHSSNTFKVFELAFVGGLACCLANHQRSKTSLLLVVVAAFLTAMSISGKGGQYDFYVFPLLAVLLAALFLDFGPFWAHRFLPAKRASCAALGIALLGLSLGAADFYKTLRTLGSAEWTHPPVGLYQLFAGESENVRIVLFDFPEPVGAFAAGKPGFNFEDFYYSPRLPKAIRLKDMAALESLLRDHKPTVVVLPPAGAPQPDVKRLFPEVRLQEDAGAYTYPLLAFHGAIAETQIDRLKRIARGGQK